MADFAKIFRDFREAVGPYLAPTLRDQMMTLEDGEDREHYDASRAANFRLHGPPPNRRAYQWWLRRLSKGD